MRGPAFLFPLLPVMERGRDPLHEAVELHQPPACVCNPEQLFGADVKAQGRALRSIPPLRAVSNGINFPVIPEVKLLQTAVLPPNGSTSWKH